MLCQHEGIFLPDVFKRLHLKRKNRFKKKKKNRREVLQTVYNETADIKGAGNPCYSAEIEISFVHNLRTKK